MSNKVPSSEVTNEFYDLLTIPRVLRRRQLMQKVWKMVWFSMSLYKFKSSRCSPCNQRLNRRRKVYRCWVSSSPIKRAKHETCKYDVNHQVELIIQMKTKIHFFQCRKDQWIHLTDVGNFLTLWCKRTFCKKNTRQWRGWWHSGPSKVAQRCCRREIRPGLSQRPWSHPACNECGRIELEDGQVIAHVTLKHLCFLSFIIFSSDYAFAGSVSGENVSV